MRYYTDLHLHSRYAYATSRHADLERLTRWAMLKGIGVMATGDFTHPKWMAQIKDKLVQGEDELFRLKKPVLEDVIQGVPQSCHSEVRMLLCVEVSTVYSQDGKIRKIHHLIFVPDLKAAERLNAALGKYGRLDVDGRPTLSLDARSLLETVLGIDPRAYLIPAHIWTPWFAVLGSKSGFDSIQECYGDLSQHIFAAETGLSADPPMCWRVPSLDAFRMVSFSDAHGPQKLGRELTELTGDPSYDTVRHALEIGEGYVGTVEFFPEEGKYHFDGHRACGVMLHPKDSKRLGGICPICHKKLTIGVLHRVEDLAARKPGKGVPEKAGEVIRMVPLIEVLAEIEQAKPEAVRVTRRYQHLLKVLGPELTILRDTSLQDIKAADGGLLEEALRRLREGQVIRESGYDGVYGRICLFADGELTKPKPRAKPKAKIIDKKQMALL